MTVATTPTHAGRAVPSERYARRAATWLAVTIGAHLLLNGAQIFETAVIVPAWTAAPPESLMLFAGAYGLDFETFWVIAHSVHEVTFVIAIVFAWRFRRARLGLRALLVLHVAVRVWTIVYFAPTIIEFQQLAQGSIMAGTDPALRSTAATWQTWNYVRVGLFIAVSGALLPIWIQVSHRRHDHPSRPTAEGLRPSASPGGLG